ncbi:hypothetical protein Tco_1102364 [Tanacetum coccineum]
MDDPNMTMEEYIKLEEEKSHRPGRVFNWQTAIYEKIRVDEDLHDLRSVETEFPSIVINDIFASHNALSSESKVSTPINDEIDFRISFDESDDEDYAIICDKNSFSYKIFFVNNLKTDSENDNYKVDMPSFPSPEPTVSYFDDLDYFNDFENEFSAIVYNDALTSKSDFLTEPTLSPQHIDEFDLKNEASLSKCDEEEQNVLYFNDLFSFNVIYPDDSKTDKDNDDDKIDIEHSSGDMSVIPLSNVINTDDGAYAHGSNKLLKTSINTAYLGVWIRRIDFLYNFRVLYEVEDITTYLVEYVKFWDDWEVDCYGNANLVIMEYLVKLSKRRAFWSLNEDILKIYDSDNQYAVSIKEDTAYPCLHSPKSMKKQAQYSVSRRRLYAVSKIQ